MREHLQAVAQATGKTPPELIQPDLPEGCGALVHIFLELNARRGSNGFGPTPITYHDLLAWQQFNGALTQWEAQTLLAMDTAATAAMVEHGNTDR